MGKLLKLLVLLSLTSCAYLKYKPVGEPKLTVAKKLETCIFRLIEDNGVESEKASKICNSIFRRR